MSIEAYLTRELDIRFIDARAIANEAKVNLGISGYVSKEQLPAVQQEAKRLFDEKPDDVKGTLRRINSDLESIKSQSSAHSKALLQQRQPQDDDVSSIGSSGSFHSTNSATKKRVGWFGFNKSSGATAATDKNEGSESTNSLASAASEPRPRKPSSSSASSSHMNRSASTNDARKAAALALATRTNMAGETLAVAVPTTVTKLPPLSKSASTNDARRPALMMRRSGGGRNSDIDAMVLGLKRNSAKKSSAMSASSGAAAAAKLGNATWNNAAVAAPLRVS